jgi:hypothetical protein
MEKAFLTGFFKTCRRSASFRVAVVFPQIPHQSVPFPNLLEQTVHFQGGLDELPSSLFSSVSRLSCSSSLPPLRPVSLHFLRLARFLGNTDILERGAPESSASEIHVHGQVRSANQPIP